MVQGAGVATVNGVYERYSFSSPSNPTRCSLLFPRLLGFYPLSKIRRVSSSSKLSPVDPTNEDQIPSPQTIDRWRRVGRSNRETSAVATTNKDSMDDNMVVVDGDAILSRVEAAKKQVELSKSMLLSSNGRVESFRTSLADARKAQETAGAQLTASREEVRHATDHLQASEGRLDSSIAQDLVNGSDGAADANEMDAVRRRAKAARIQVKLSQSAVLSSRSIVDMIEKSLAIAERDQKVASIKFKASQLELYHATNSLKMVEGDHAITSNSPGTVVGGPALVEKANEQRGFGNCWPAMSAPGDSLHFEVHGDAENNSIGVPSHTSWQIPRRCVKPKALQPSRNLVISSVVHPKQAKVEQRARGSAIVRPKTDAVPIVRVTPTIIRPKALRVRGVGMAPPELPPDSNLSLTDISFIEDWIRNPDSSLFSPVDDAHHPCSSGDGQDFVLGTGPVPI